MENLRNKFLNKNQKLTNQWKAIYQKFTDEEKAEINNSFPEYTDLKDKILSVIFNDYKRCTICDKVISWSNTALTCSHVCSLEQVKKTNLEKYGVDNPSKSQIVKEKIKSTNLEKYGVDNPSKSQIVKEKIKSTNLEKYGVDNPSKSQIVKDKLLKTNNERFGGNSPQSSKEIKLKSISTLNEKYGVTVPLRSEEIKLRKKETDIKKYGVDHHFKNDEIKSKIKETHNNSKIDYFNEKYSINNERIKELSFDINRNYSKEYIYDILKYIENGIIPNFNIIKNEFSQSSYNRKIKFYGYENKQSSTFEYELAEFLDLMGIGYKLNCRKIISPFELDIYIPEHNLAIEFNGWYWHSDIYKDKYYHQNKTKMCNDKGITLIHIHEYLYNYKSDVYKSIIKSKLGLNKRVYARKCVLKEVPKHEEKEFLNTYHLQGFVGSNKCYGLYYNNELLTLCSFGKSRFNTNYEYELLRNCTKSGITVVGGLSKIIKHYKKEIDNVDILCYNDASISYNKNNNLTPPNYVWVKHNLILTRYQTMKHKLDKLLGESFNEKLSETDNMKNNGFCRVYDSGNYITII